MYPDSVRLIYHHFPSNDYSYLLAELLEAAGAQGKFWEVHDVLVDQVPTDRAAFDDLVNSLDLDTGLISKALQDYTYHGAVEEAKRQAEDNGITETGLFINGTPYQESPGSFEDFRQTIEQAIEEAGASSGVQQ